LQPQETIEAASTPFHPGYASVHLGFFDYLTACDLIHPELHLGVEPALFSQQAIHGFNDEIRGAAAGARRKICQCVALSVGKLHFHIQSLGIANISVK
jgi:hypothetical protein